VSELRESSAAGEKVGSISTSTLKGTRTGIRNGRPRLHEWSTLLRTAKREPSAADEANRAVLRRDFEAMRDQQMMREQARQAAMAEALRRRGQ